jgi:uncharacterized protein YceK
MKKLLVVVIVLLVTGCMRVNHRYKPDKVYKKGYFIPGKY